MEGERRRRLLVLYGSASGTAEEAAERLGREALRRGCPSVHVLSAQKFDASSLPLEDIVIFVVCTRGRGDMPRSMQEFWKFLVQKNISKRWLEHVHYAVFGLGDSSYEKYNYAAKKLDMRLLKIGGKPIIEVGLGDAEDPLGYEAAFDPWLLSLWNALHKMDPTLLPNLDSSSHRLERPKFEVTFHDINMMTDTQISLSDLNRIQNLIGNVRSMSLAESHYKKPQYLLRMITNEQLTKSEAEKVVHHFEFESSLSALQYQVGDVLEVLPAQDPVAVDAFIRRAELDPDSYITVRRKVVDDHDDSSVNMSTEPVKLKTFVELAMDVASASPDRYFFEIMSFFATNENEKEWLQYLSSAAGRNDLYRYNERERRTVLEVLEDFPSVQLPFEWLVQLAPPLRTRAFSISSSPLAHPGQVHLTVKALTWTTPFKRQRSGLCSNWLAGVDPRKGVPIPAWIHGGCLAAPAPSEPLILVGPGTGCAPFRGFVEERAAQKAAGAAAAAAPILFFFGCWNEDKDFLYRDLWLSHARDGGVLSADGGGGFFAAFSRDQARKVYVQHKMEEERKRVWRLLSGGAAVYIAGSTRMAADVIEALEEIIAEEAGLSEEAAARWLRKERAKKIFIEAWS